MIPVLYRSIAGATMFHKNIMNGFKCSGKKNTNSILIITKGHNSLNVGVYVYVHIS